jgi:hypothetical protein
MADRMAVVYVPSTGHILGALAHPRAELPITVDAIAPDGVYLRNLRGADTHPAVPYFDPISLLSVTFDLLNPQNNGIPTQPYTYTFGDEQFFVEPPSLAVKAVAFDAGVFSAPRLYTTGAANVRLIDPGAGKRPNVLLDHDRISLSLPETLDVALNFWIQIEPKGGTPVPEEPRRRVVQSVIPAKSAANTDLVFPLGADAGLHAASLPDGNYCMLVLVDGYLPDPRSQNLA